jgi:hypothetical protein
MSFGVMLFKCHVHKMIFINIFIIIILQLLLQIHMTSFDPMVHMS